MLSATAAQYFKSIQDSPLIELVPNIFLEQAQTSEDCFISGRMFRDRLFTLTVSDAKPVGTDRVVVKLSIVAIFNPTTGEVIPQTDKGAKALPTGFIYLPGFNSLPNIEFGPQEVANGTLTPLQLQQLIEYGQKWQAGLTTSANPRHWYEPGNTNYRVYFSDIDETSEFRFVPEERINPTNSEPVVGIGQPLLYNVRLLGSGITAGTTTLRTRNPVQNLSSTYAPNQGATDTAPVSSRVSRFKF